MTVRVSRRWVECSVVFLEGRFQPAKIWVIVQSSAMGFIEMPLNKVGFECGSAAEGTGVTAAPCPAPG